MKKVSILLVLIAMSLVSLAQVQPQQQKQPDSIQVYQFTMMPQTFNTGIKVLQDICIPKGSTSKDSLVFNSLSNMLFSNGKAIMVANPNVLKKQPEVKKK